MTEQPMAQVQDGTIRFSWSVPTDQATLWTSLTTPEIVGKWMSCEVTLEPEVGGRVAFGWPEDEGNASGEVTRFEPTSVLEYTWGGSGWNEVSHVLWEVAPEGAQCRLDVTHYGLTGSTDDILELAAGWHDFLGALMSELGEPALDDSHDELIKKYKERGTT